MTEHDDGAAARRQAIIESIEAFYKVGAVPRVVVDSNREGVDVPPWLKEMFGPALPIELRPEYPMDLAFTETALEATLSFKNTVYRCIFPWRSIYVISDTITGQGGVIVSHLPPNAEVVAGPDGPIIDIRGTEASQDPKAVEMAQRLAKSGLRVVKDGKA